MMSAGAKLIIRLAILRRCDKISSKTWAYIKIAVLAIGVLYFLFRAAVAADAGDTANTIYYLFFVWLIARE